MKKGFLMLALLPVVFTACSSMKNKTAKGNSGRDQVAALAGTWELDVIAYSKAPFDSLYKDKKPSLTFEPEKMSFYGNSSCNGLNGKLDAEGSKINFQGDITMTLKGCFSEGEPVFMESLKKVNRFNVSTDTKELTFMQGDVALMHFRKK